MIEELKRFITIVDTSSITKAAEKLFITQPALSLSLLRLEKALNTKLIKRNTKHLTITPDGLAIYTTSKKILSLWEKMQDPLQRNNKKILYTIGMYDNAALRLAAYFSTLQPTDGISFEMIIDSSGKLYQYMRQGMLDVCISVISIDDSHIPECKLVASTKEILLPVSNKKWGGDIKDIPFILYNSGSTTRNYIDQTFQDNHISPSVVAQSTSTTFMKELALNGIGVALLPKNFVENEIKHHTLYIQKLPISWKRTIGIYIPNGGTFSENSPIISQLWSYFIK